MKLLQACPGSRVIGVDAQGAPIVLRGAGQPALQCQDICQVVVGLRVIGFELHGLLEMRGRGMQLALLGQHDVEVLGPRRPARRADRERRAPAKKRALPLEGIRVANFGWGWLGPVAGQTLSFLGAEVYKVESRVRIDINRTLPPFGEGIRDPDRSLQNHAGWAGNGSVTLDLKKPEGQELARRLVASSSS